MPTETLLRPKFLKGALAVYESQQAGTSSSTIVTFQYNPDTVRRTLERRAVEGRSAGAGGWAPNKEDLLRAAGPPNEQITMTVTIDATDQLEFPDQNDVTVERGIYPQLSVLEMLLYPSTAKVDELQRQTRQGEVQVSPADLPLVLLVWGKSRVVPVLITGFTINEEEFDGNLNPIRASVELNMKVLTYLELKTNTLGGDAYVTYQRNKEQHAQALQPNANEGSIRRLLPGSQGRR
jgi:hypothetical protein